MYFFSSRLFFSLLFGDSNGFGSLEVMRIGQGYVQEGKGEKTTFPENRLNLFWSIGDVEKPT